LESNLVVQKQYVLAAQPLSDLFRCFTVVMALTKFEFESQLLRCSRVVVSPDCQLISINALEFLLVSRHFPSR